MMYHNKKYFFIITAFVLLACSLSSQAKALITPTAPPVLQPTLTTVPADQLTSVVSPKDCTDVIGKVTDKNFPDDSQVDAGQTLMKTWEIANAGTCPWTAGYQIVFIAEEQLGGISPMPLGAVVNPGETTEINIQFTVPDTAGRHRSMWMLKNPQGKVFGSGEKADQPFWVQVIGANLPQAQPAQVSGAGTATLQANPSIYNGVCPVSLQLSGTITLNNPGNSTYKLEMGSDDPSYKFSLPDAENHEFVAGEALNVSWPILLSRTVNGWARLHVSSGADFYSDKYAFMITCP